mgnify:FL=1
MIKSPNFWYQKRGLLSYALWPLGVLYGVATAFRLKKLKGTLRAKCPVICVGNINVGGTGKTPTTIALVERLQARGHTIVVISRGYRGSETGPVLVNPMQHTAKQVGDEPLLISAFCAVVVARDRRAALKLAEEQVPDVILMDDGFQSPLIHKDLSIVVVNAALGFGNGFCIPAGPLREPVNGGLKRSDIFLSIGPEDSQKIFQSQLTKTFDETHVTGEIKPLHTGMHWEGLDVFAFAGIAHPLNFLTTLKRLGANIRGHEALSDHEPLSPALMKRLASKAAKMNAQMVCTEKDAARLPMEYRKQVLALPVRLEISDWSKIDIFLDELGLF